MRSIGKSEMHKTTRKIAVLGLRGFPEVQGGIETHSENLYPLICSLGFDVVCITRSPYHNRGEWKGVRFKRVWAPKSKYFEAIVHSVLGVFQAARLRPDVLHIHGVGPSLVAPLGRLLGLKVVVTHHGPDYDREKWNWVAKSILRFGEWCGMRFANERIVISPVIEAMVRKKYSVESTIIPNGVRLPELAASLSYIERHGLEPNNYVLLVSRIVPEKRHFDLISAFEKCGIPEVKLALVGDSDHPDNYSRSLKARVAEDPNLVLTGFIRGEELRALFQHARLFVLPSSHEGLPISLLEALSYGLPCLASNIPANVAVGMDADCYFELGNTDELARKIEDALSRDWSQDDRERIRSWIEDTYDWKKIAEQTVEVYEKIA